MNLAPMNGEELRQAMEEPAQLVGLTFEPGWIELIVEHVGDEQGHLPLLEVILRELWDERRGGELHHEAYRTMNYLKGAIAKKAESFYAQLPPVDQQGVQQIFLRLVRPGAGKADTRQ